MLRNIFRVLTFPFRLLGSLQWFIACCLVVVLAFPLDRVLAASPRGHWVYYAVCFGTIAWFRISEVRTERARVRSREAESAASTRLKAQRDATPLTVWKEREAARTLERNVFAAHVEAVTDPDELVRLLQSSTRWHTDAPASGEGDAPKITIANRARVFNTELVSGLVQHRASSALIHNPHLSDNAVTDLAWRLGGGSRTYETGYAVNMGQQLGARDPFKDLICTHKLTALHAVAQRIFEYAVGRAEVPERYRDMQPEFKRTHALQVLRFFPEWPGEWNEQLAPLAAELRRKPAPPPPENPLVEGSVMVIMAPVLVCMAAWFWVQDAWND